MFFETGRFVDEFLWKGARDAPLVQRIGAVILALAYVFVGLTFISIAAEQQDWSAAVFAVLLFVAAGWFIRNALRK
jgi:membrane associated rhomboid family serine protease